jgi:hypothetical protein
MGALASYIAIHGSNADVQPVYRAIREAIARAEPTGELGRYADDAHLDAIVEWVRQHHGAQPPKGCLSEPPPHIVDPEIPTDEPEAPGDWYSKCLAGSDGRTLSNLSNTLLALGQDRVWSHMLLCNGMFDAALLTRPLPPRVNEGK